MRRELSGFALLVLSCSRTSLELDSVGDDSDAVTRGGTGSHGDDSGTGGLGAVGATGGALATGGIGGKAGSSPGGSGPGSGGGTAGGAGQPEPPIEPGGPIPDCSNDSPAFTPIAERRWLSLELTSSEDEVARFIVQLTPDGPQYLTRVTPLGEEWSFDGWSADGRYFALSRSMGKSARVAEIFDLAAGVPPVPIEVPEPNGFVRWSPTDTRYYVVQLTPMSRNRSMLTLADAATGSEQSVEVSSVFDSTEWSPDGRFISLTGEGGVALIDTLRPPLFLQEVEDRFVSRARWSPDGHYLAFTQGSPHVYDVETAALDPIDGPATHIAWYRHDWLAFNFTNGGAFFVDLTRRPWTPVSLVGQFSVGAPSPGGKCVAYQGHCNASSLDGTCVRSLPPDPETPPILIGLESEVSFFWPGSADHLLVERHREPRLIHVELRGSDFIRRFIEPTERRDMTSWNPSGHPDWFVYAVPRPDLDTIRPRLWHRETQQSFLVGPRSAGVPEEVAWSPDGRYFAYNDALRTDGTSGTILYQELRVLEVLDGELGREWTVGAPTGNAGGGTRDFHWQP